MAAHVCSDPSYPDKKKALLYKTDFTAIGKQEYTTEDIFSVFY